MIFSDYKWLLAYLWSSRPISLEHHKSKVNTNTRPVKHMGRNDELLSIQKFG